MLGHTSQPPMVTIGSYDISLCIKPIYKEEAQRWVASCLPPKAKTTTSQKIRLLSQFFCKITLWWSCLFQQFATITSSNANFSRSLMCEISMAPHICRTYKNLKCFNHIGRSLTIWNTNETWKNLSFLIKILMMIIIDLNIVS